MSDYIPQAEAQYLDANGNPLIGGSVEFYVPNTLTPKDTYQDSGQTTLNNNPITLDGAGRCVAYGDGSYRQIVKDSNGNTIWDEVVTVGSTTNQNYAADTGAANVYEVTLPLVLSSLTDGLIVYFNAGNANTGDSTLNVNGTGAIPLTNDDGTALSSGAITAGMIYQVVYNQTANQWQIMAPINPNSGTSTTHITFTGSLTLPVGDSGKDIIPYNLTAAATLTLPSSPSTGTKYRILSSSLYTVTISAGARFFYNTNGLNIGSTYNFPVVEGQWAFIIFDGSNWNISTTADSVAIGDFILTANPNTRPGFLLCDGSAVSRTTYAALFSVISTTWGVGDGSTTFNLPDYRGRSPIGVGTGTGLTARAMGDTGGEETHALTADENGPHTHSYTNDTNNPQAQPGGSGTGAGYPHTQTTGTSGLGTGHNTMHPYAVCNFMIKY